MMFAEAAQGFPWESMAVVIAGVVLTALFSMLGWIAVKVGRHDVADVKLKAKVKAVRKDIGRLEEKMDGGFAALGQKIDEALVSRTS